LHRLRTEEKLDWEFRIGIHCGYLSHLKTDLGEVSIGRSIINAARIMDFGKANHILLTRDFYQLIAEPLPEYRQYCHEIGEFETKHGVKIGVYNFYHQGNFGNPDDPIPYKVKILPDHKKADDKEKAIERAKYSIDILASSGHSFFSSRVRYILENKLNKNEDFKVRILLLYPISSKIWELARSEQKDGDELKEKSIQAYCENLKPLQEKFKNRFEIKFYKFFPPFRLFIIDRKQMYVAIPKIYAKKPKQGDQIHIHLYSSMDKLEEKNETFAEFLRIFDKFWTKKPITEEERKIAGDFLVENPELQCENI